MMHQHFYTLWMVLLEKSIKLIKINFLIYYHNIKNKLIFFYKNAKILTQFRIISSFLLYNQKKILFIYLLLFYGK